MKFCVHCGGEVHEEAVICVHCGRSIGTFMQTKTPNRSDNYETMSVIAKVFLILSCIAQGWMILPLIWCIPITVAVFNRLRDNRPIGTGLKVCTLLFVNLVAGICLLCIED